MTDKPPIVIEATGLTKSFKKTEVLRGVDLAVERGTMFALLGPNGAGKTTTVRILSTLLPADGGVATIAGHDVSRAPDEVRNVMGITGQYATVDEILTGRENLVMIGRLYHLGKAAAQQRADELLEQFDLVDAGKRPVKTYSGGMRRRLDLAASLIAKPPIIFLDEPTTGLDPRSRQGMWNVIRELLQSGITILLTTQYLEEADQLADRVAVIDDGRIIAEGTPDDLKSAVGTERLELEFADSAELTAAAAVIGGDTLRLDDQDRRLSLAVDGPDDVRQVLTALDLAGVKVADMTLSRPTLDDVFMALTGSDPTHEEADAA
ncbi:ATP-binding cassette domain-containing protein [Phytoactinopolyspora mesophila]|uniref:ATP-binding cassette domain-containing protein n=1 Tax=Phytoactinopolyspora mesophila TaxID=2650750 RepID=A0A7K3LYH6_9ACTN|nr:ATP-binding cassette domain-containing protein [Phytoactinopolyspora mesophila]NDL56059.1 ATP-binding cassette domain-containing protein [Phytoactinopolyspora mesophila]